MNKQEFIERMKFLKNIFGNKSEYIEIDAVIELASELDEPQKVMIPRFIADWIVQAKEDGYNIAGAINEAPRGAVDDWLELENVDIFAEAWINGYTVEKEKRYTVKMKGVDSRTNYLYYGVGSKSWLFKTKLIDGLFRKSHTRKELEEAGFEEVFNSPLFEVEEVEE